MGRMTGFEPANDRFTAGCVNHFTTSAITAFHTAIIFYINFNKKTSLLTKIISFFNYLVHFIGTMLLSNKNLLVLEKGFEPKNPL